MLYIDESNFSDGSFYHKLWTPRGVSSKIRQKQIQPRVTMIVVADSKGGLYSSHFQCNANQYTFMLVLYEFVALLDSEDANWREKGIFLCDNARFHHAKGVKELFRKLRMGVLFSSPHSPAIIPVEMVRNFKRIFIFVCLLGICQDQER